MNGSLALSNARAAGLTVTVGHGKLAVRGAGSRRPDLIEAIRQHRGEVIAIINAEAAKKAKEEKEVQLYGWSIHPARVPFPDVMPQFSDHERGALIARVMREGKLATGWCLVRANEYFQKYPNSSFEEQDAAAAADFLKCRMLWQQS